MHHTEAPRVRRVPRTAWLALLLLLAVLATGHAQAQGATLQPVADATLYSEDGGAANGAGGSLFAGRIANGEQRRALLQFDVASAVPAGATITSATLELSVTRTIAGAVPLALHRVLQPWGEGASLAEEPAGRGVPAADGDATWTLRFFPEAPWDVPGGDFAGTPSAVAEVLDSRHAWSGPGLVADVQAWLQAPQDNHGWILTAADATVPSAKRFASREAADAALRPTLSLTWVVAAPAANPAPIRIPAAAPGWLALLAVLAAGCALAALRRP